MSSGAASVRADDRSILDRWMHRGDQGRKEEKGVEGKGFRHLKNSQKVNITECDGATANCLCQTGSTLKTFWETTGFNAPQERKVMCVPSCQRGTIMRKAVNVDTGVVSFACKKPSEVGKP